MKRKPFSSFSLCGILKRRALVERDGAGGLGAGQYRFSFYTFVRCEPGEYIIRLEMNPSSDYRAFIKELGAEYIGSCVNWVYFRRKAELGSFALLSDIDSRLTHLKRIDRMLSLLCLANLIFGVTNSLNQFRYGWLNLLCAALLSYALGRIHSMKAALEKSAACTNDLSSLFAPQPQRKSGVSLDKKTIANPSPS